MGTVFANIGAEEDPTALMGNYLKYFPLMMIIFTGVFFGWQWWS